MIWELPLDRSVWHAAALAGYREMYGFCALLSLACIFFIIICMEKGCQYEKRNIQNLINVNLRYYSGLSTCWSEENW